jgi:reactive intermediate/imine deaminase
MTRKSIQTDRAPAAIGPYSQAIKTGATIYLSGQIALDPASMELVNEDIAAQTRQVFDNLAAVAEAAGGGLSHIVKLTAYLTDLGDFGQVNEIMASYFEAPYPARAAVGVAALPRGALIEMDAIMVVDE